MEDVSFRPADLIVPERRTYIASGRCVPPPFGCGADVGKFRDLMSLQEYRISGLCQKCQDKVFRSVSCDAKTRTTI